MEASWTANTCNITGRRGTLPGQQEAFVLSRVFVLCWRVVFCGVCVFVFCVVCCLVSCVLCVPSVALFCAVGKFCGKFHHGVRSTC